MRHYKCLTAASLSVVFLTSVSSSLGHQTTVSTNIHLILSRCWIYGYFFLVWQSSKVISPRLIFQLMGWVCFKKRKCVSTKSAPFSQHYLGFHFMKAWKIYTSLCSSTVRATESASIKENGNDTIQIQFHFSFFRQFSYISIHTAPNRERLSKIIHFQVSRKGFLLAHQSHSF